MAKKTKKIKKSKKLERKDFQRKEVKEGFGEFRLKHGYGKHNLSKTVSSMTIKGKRLKKVVEPGDILICRPSSVMAFMDKFVRIDVLPEPEKIRQKSYKRQHIGGGRYNVINTVSGVKINDEHLSKEEADEMIRNEGIDPDPEPIVHDDHEEPEVDEEFESEEDDDEDEDDEDDEDEEDDEK